MTRTPEEYDLIWARAREIHECGGWCNIPCTKSVHTSDFSQACAEFDAATKET